MPEKYGGTIGLTPVPTPPSAAFDIVEIDAVVDAPKQTDGAVTIAAALLQANGPVWRYGWISLLNLGAAPLDLDGWTLENATGAQVDLRGVVEPGHAVAMRDAALLALRLSDHGDTLTLRRGAKVIDQVWFGPREMRDGRALSFRGGVDPHPLADPRPE